MRSLSEAGWDGPDRSTMQQMSNRKRAANAGQRFYLMARKYKSKFFSNVSCIVECLLDSGNTTTPGVAISQQLANDLGLTIVPYHTPVRNGNGGCVP